MNTLRLSLALVLLFVAACSKSAPPAEAKKEPQKAEDKLVELDAAALREVKLVISPVLERSVPRVIRAAGRLATNENTTWRVGAVTDGRIITAPAKVGDRVQKHQILARMHSHDIHESRALYRRAVADATRAKANLEFAQKQRERLRRLFSLKAASQEQVDQVENEFRTAQAGLENAQIEENRTRMHLVEFLEVPLTGSTEKDHSPSLEIHEEDLIPIRAPESGVVLARNITPGAVVNAASDLFTLCDLSTIWAVAAVQEEHLADVRPGQLARVSVQAYPNRTFLGKVAKIDEKLDSETRTVQVRIEIDNRAGLLKPEMYASVELDGTGSESGLWAPATAVQDVNGQSTVFIEKSPGKFEARPVETGRTLEGNIQILRGLKPSERVVSEGSFIVKSQLLKASLAEE